MRALSVLTLLGVLVAADVSAQSLPHVRKDPFSRLFTTDDAPAVPMPALAPLAPPVRLFDTTPRTGSPAPIVVCGMTLMPVDPSIDPKIQFKPPPTRQTPVITTVAPARCR